MSQNQQQQYDDTNRGVLFIHDKGGNDKAPDRKGSINIEGVEYWISGWVKRSQKGDPFMSLSVQPKIAKDAAQQMRPPMSQATPVNRGSTARPQDDDDINF